MSNFCMLLCASMQGEEKKRKDMQVPRDQNFDALLSWWILGSLGVEGQVGWWWCCSTGSGKGGMEEMYVLWCTRDPASFWCHSCFVIRNQKEGWFNLVILEFSGFPQTSSKCMVPRFFEGFPPQKKNGALTPAWCGKPTRRPSPSWMAWIRISNASRRWTKHGFFRGKLPRFAGSQWAHLMHLEIRGSVRTTAL